MTLNCIAIGSRIKSARRRRGMSQSFLSELIDLSPAYISYIENGTKCMSLETFIKLANALSVSADELLVDNLENTVRVSNHSFANLLSDCTEYERRILLDIATIAKKSLRLNMGYLHFPRK